jgi:arylsulfatase A-like enzyme/Flp pilus assembly protein TadD
LSNFRALLVASVCALLAPALVGATPPRSARPNVLWITIDTLRADALGWSGASRPTPRLDALASRGARFPRAVSPAPVTLPSHASMFSGLVPRRHGARDNGQVLDAAVPLLAERLRAAGWRTAAVISGHPLRSLYGLDRGFETYDDRLPAGAGGGWGERRADETARIAAGRITALGTAAPWFLWVHFFDPHDPYEPPAELRAPGPGGDYLGEVAAVDRALAPLLAAAAAAGPALVVVAGDHGESLGEHGESTHGFFVYDATVTVPLVLEWPGRIAERAIDAPARLVDLAPTVLDLLGLPPLPETDGESLRPLLEGRRATPWPGAEIEARQPWLGYGWAPLRALRTTDRKLVVAPRPELYDLRLDPDETTNRFEDDRRTAAALASELRRRDARSPVGAVAPATDGAERRALAALGYLSGGSSSEPPATGLADPKDRLELKARLEQAEAARLRGTPEALAAFEAVLATEPDNRFALLRVGQLRLETGGAEAARRPLERLIALDPRHPEARWALAEVLSRSGSRREAAAAWSAVVALQPRRAAGWSNLGAEQFAGGDLEAAVDSLRRARELDRGDRTITANLATLLLERAARAAQAGDLDAARALRSEAIALAPELLERARRDRRLSRLPPP